MERDGSKTGEHSKEPVRGGLDELVAELQARQALHDEWTATRRYDFGLPLPATQPNQVTPGFGTLSDVERREFLRRMAAAGGIGFLPSPQLLSPLTSALAGTHPPATSGSRPDGVLWAEAVREAVVWPATPQADSVPPPLEDLRASVDLAFRLDLASRRSILGATLPGLIGDAEHLVGHVSGDTTVQALRVLADVYGIACWTLIKADDAQVAWVAAERSLHAARRANDPLRIAIATRCLSEAHMRAGRLDVATRIATEAPLRLSAVPDEDMDGALSVRGAALLSAAASAARAQDEHDAREALAAANACARQLGEDRTDLGIAFGPTNVAIHRVVVAIELGDAKAARRYADQVDLAPLPTWLGERRSRFLIDLARAQAQMRDDIEALRTLLRAENTAPEEARSHRLTRGLVRELLSRERRSSSPGLRAFATRCGVLDG
jgi:hypothetical protein